MSITDVEYRILVAGSCDEARPDRDRLYERQAQTLDTDGQSLQTFVRRYLEQVPVSLRTAQTSARQMELQSFILPITQAIENFFDRHCELSEDGGRLALLDRAYIGHRMLEELNDHLHVHTGVYILHLDMTEANMVVHTLIGEPYATELDSIVNQTMSLLVDGMEQLDTDNPQPSGETLESFMTRSGLRLHLAS